MEEPLQRVTPVGARDGKPLVDWPGTLLLVSHDRAFIDHVVTSTLVFEGGGRVQEYVGGYEDWLRQREPAEPPAPAPVQPKPRPVEARPSTSRKLSYREQQEALALPGRIDELEREQETLKATVADPAFYRTGADAVKQTLYRLEALEQELLAAYSRWHELDR